MSSKTLTMATAAFALSLGSVTLCRAAPAKTITMTVTDKGFEPAKANVKKGEPVTLAITRTTEKTCATEIVIDDPKVNAKLPLNKEVKVTFTPTKTGELRYGCGMDKMIGGVLTVE